MLKIQTGKRFQELADFSGWCMIQRASPRFILHNWVSRPRKRQNLFTSRWLLAQKNDQSVNYKLCEYEIQARSLLSVLWPVENVEFCINSICHLGWLCGISNFLRFHKNVNLPELWKYIFENSLPKGSLWGKLM